MWLVLWAIALLAASDQVEAQGLVPTGGSVIQPNEVVVHPPSGSGRISGGTSRSGATPGAQPARPGTTPFTLAGQTVCSRGTVEERPADERRYWFDGSTVNLPGFRCITLP
jgi:hypothetical protein